MDTTSKHNSTFIYLPLNNFANRMFVSVVGIFLLLAVTFIVFQYKREAEYKVDILTGRLQVVNYQVEAMWPDTTFALPTNCRLTVLDLK